MKEIQTSDHKRQKSLTDLIRFSFTTTLSREGALLSLYATCLPPVRQATLQQISQTSAREQLQA